MHKIFGTKEEHTYLDREGVYLIPICDNKVGVVQTSKGYFLLGGGLENGESHVECIEREVMEEIGYTVSVKKKIGSAETYCKHSSIGFFHPIQTYYSGTLGEKVCDTVEKDHNLVWLEYEKLKGKMYAEMQSWALEHYFKTGNFYT